MAITIYSPHSGHPVKVREADVGRAIRDEAGRIFYVVARSQGGGYYGSMTRQGSDKDEQRYLDLEARIARGEFVPEPVGQASSSPAAATPHDATGRRRVAPVRLVVAIIILLAALGGAGVAADWWLSLGLTPLSQPTSPPATQPAPATSQAPAAAGPLTEPFVWPIPSIADCRKARRAAHPLASRYDLAQAPCPRPAQVGNYHPWHFAA
jgi:hypothetical protein